VIKKWKVDYSKDTSSISYLRIKIVYTSTGVLVDDNTYWLSSTPDDYSKLFELQPAMVNATVLKKTGNKFTVEVANKGTQVAFFIRMKALRSSDSRVVSPIIVDDNYFTLLPGEKKLITLDVSSLPEKDKNVPLSVELNGVNFPAVRILL